MDHAPSQKPALREESWLSVHDWEFPHFQLLTQNDYRKGKNMTKDKENDPDANSKRSDSDIQLLLGTIRDYKASQATKNLS